VLDDDFKFHKDLIDFQRNEIISKHYSLNAARVRLFRISIGEPLQRLDVAAEEHLEILDACLDRDVELAVTRLARHIEISREHTLGLRPMRRS
jgi:DNA-binding GntR family transcriptional regulator